MQTGPLIPSCSITGANGFIGRWLLVELTQRRIQVNAFLRDADERAEELRTWVSAHGGHGSMIECFDFDLEQVGLGLSTLGHAALTEAPLVYHLAARYRFGLSRTVAERVNVAAAVELVHVLGGAAPSGRLVHISGYRTEGQPAQALDVHDPAALLRFYDEHGAYEASKMEAHVRVFEAAQQLDVPLIRVSPAVVIGDSRTGETTQIVGLGHTIEQMWLGRLPALAGSPDSWLPIVPIDLLCRVLAEVGTTAAYEGCNLTVFDDRTPTLQGLLEIAASRMDRNAPRWHLPLWLVRALPTSLTGVDRESLSFVSTDRYDPRPLAELCERSDLTLPPVGTSVERWVDNLLDTRFGTRPARGAHSIHAAGTRVFLRGERHQPAAVLLHGLLLNEHSWSPITDKLDAPVLVPDLPGLGRSAPGGGTPAAWLTGLLAPTKTRPVLVGHSLGSAFALSYAAAHPDRVSELVLVSPFFLQPAPAWWMGLPWLMSLGFLGLNEARFAGLLGAPIDDALSDAATLIRRPSVRHHTARWLSWVRRPEVRQDLVRQLAELPIPTTLVVGTHDPLEAAVPDGIQVIEVAGAAHYLQVTHPEALTVVIREAIARSRSPPRWCPRAAEARSDPPAEPHRRRTTPPADATGL